MTRSEMQLARRAINLRWPITEAIRREVVEKARQILNGPERQRDKLAAAKLLIDADRINVAEFAATKGNPPAPVQINILRIVSPAGSQPIGDDGFLVHESNGDGVLNGHSGS
jgi:hypothetical protein